MKWRNLPWLFSAAFLFMGTEPSRVSEPPPILVTVKPDNPVAVIQPTMWGLFYEDIKLAADGGLYTELVTYRFSIFASVREGDLTINVQLVTQESGVIGGTLIHPEGADWEKYTSEFQAAHHI